MSWSMVVIGRDKAKLKEAVRQHQCKDEVSNPHNGVPKHVVDHVCAEIDRVRIYEFADKTYGLHISSSGSFHEQGCSETLSIGAVQLVE